MKKILYILIGIYFSVQTYGQNFPGPVGDVSTTAVFKDDQRVDYWLEDSVVIQRGYVDISDPSLGYVTYGDVEFALGESDPNVISLGDGGTATYVLSNSISDQEGFDFAVFENAFDDYFLELAFVEVSTDGINYVRFVNQSNTDTDSQTGAFGATYTENVNNLAGKYKAQYGTPFDLSELEDSLDIDISNINFIRIIDVVGSVNSQHASLDSYGNIINDPWPTPFNSSGFDLDGLAILKPVELSINEVDNSITYNNNVLSIKESSLVSKIQVYDLTGKLVFVKDVKNNLDLDILSRGIYVLKVNNSISSFNMKINVK